MNLRDYLHHKHITAKELAKDLNISPNYLRLIKNKKLIPSLELATNIEMLTGGLVTIKELRNG